MSIKNIYAIDESITESITSVKIRLNKGWDYLWFNYQPTRGYISITSSFGSYDYIWSAMGEGTTLPQFFTKADKHYLSGKLFSSTGRNSEVFDINQAFKDVKKDFLRDFRQGVLIDAYEVRLIYDELINLEEEMDSEGSHEAFIDNLFQLENFSKYNPEPFHRNYGFVPCGSFLTLRDEIIPIIKDYFIKAYNLNSEFKNV